MLLVENNTKGEITVSDVYDSFSMTNIMMDAIMYSATIKSGFSGAMRIQLSESDLEEQQITSVEDIQEMEISLDIANNQGKKIDSPTVKMSLE